MYNIYQTYSSLSFEKCVHLYNPHYNQDIIFSPQKVSSCPSAIDPIPTTPRTPLEIRFPISRISYKWSDILCLLFIWVLLLSIFNHSVICISSMLFVADEYTTICLPIHVYMTFGLFPDGEIMNKIAIYVQVLW